MAAAERPSVGTLRRAARVAAVQALYQIELGGQTAETVIEEFAAFRMGGRDLPETQVAVPEDVDIALFADLVRGVSAALERIDDLVEGALDKQRSVPRLEVMMRAILRAGAYELAERADIDPALTISEYVAVGDVFFNEREPALVNAVLDRLAHRLAEADQSSKGTKPDHEVAKDG